MSDKDINQMDFKELRNEVQLLRDELAIMQRKYEDLFYNLDTENFSGNFLKGINSKVSSGEVETMISQSADEIKLYAKKEAKSQSSGVYSELSVSVNEIQSTVNILGKSVSSIDIRADSIESRVTDIVGGEESIFTQTSDGFTLDGRRVTLTGILYFTDDNGKNDFWIVHDQSQDPNFKQVMFSTGINSNGKYTPIVIGDIDSDRETNVYIGGYAEGNQVATRQWVLNQLGK